MDYNKLKDVSASMYRLYSEYHDLNYISSYEIKDPKSNLGKISEQVMGVPGINNKEEQFISIYGKNENIISEEKIYGKANFISLEKILNITEADIWDEGGGRREEWEKRILSQYK